MSQHAAPQTVLIVGAPVRVTTHRRLGEADQSLCRRGLRGGHHDGLARRSGWTADLEATGRG